MGTGKGKIVVSYEDSAGKVTTIEKEFTSEVTEYVQPDSPDIAPVAVSYTHLISLNGL